MQQDINSFKNILTKYLPDSIHDDKEKKDYIDRFCNDYSYEEVMEYLCSSTDDIKKIFFSFVSPNFMTKQLFNPGQFEKFEICNNKDYAKEFANMVHYNQHKIGMPFYKYLIDLEFENKNIVQLQYINEDISAYINKNDDNAKANIHYLFLYTKQYLLNLEYEKNKYIQNKKESDQYLNILTKIFDYIDNNVELLSNKQCEFLYSRNLLNTLPNLVKNKLILSDRFSHIVLFNDKEDYNKTDMINQFIKFFQLHITQNYNVIEKEILNISFKQTQESSKYNKKRL